MRVNLSLLVITLGTAVPRAYLAMQLVNDDVFKTKARKFVAQEFALKETQVANSKINPTTRTIALAFIGHPLSQSNLQNR